MDKDVLIKLKNISIFEDIKKQEEKMKILVDACVVKKYKKGQVIIKEGELGSEMYVVYSGSVEIKKRTRAGDSYTVIRLNADQNVFFGELALIDDDKRSATVIASEDSDFLIITKKAFLELGKSNPEIAYPVTRAVAQSLAGRLRKTTQDMLTIFDALVNELKE